MIKYLAGAALAALLVVPLVGEAQARSITGNAAGAFGQRGGGGGGGGGGITTNRNGGFNGGNAGAGNRGGFNRGGGGVRNGGGFRGGSGNGYRGRGYRGRGSVYVVPGYYPGFYDPFYPYGYGYGFGYNSYYPYDYPDYAYAPPPDRGPAGYDDYLPPPAEMGPAPAQVWYYCDDPQGYYPYVRNCSHDWQSVPANPPGAAGQQGANAPRELPAPPDDRASLDRDRN